MFAQVKLMRRPRLHSALSYRLLRDGCRPALLVGAMSVMVVGCGESGMSAGSSSSGGDPSTSVTTVTTPPQPQIDHTVVRWKKRWQLKIHRPMLHSIAIMQANAIPAVNGDAAASYRLTRAFNVLSNCRNPLEFPPLGDTPATLGRARSLTLKACKTFYVGTSQVISGLNSQSSTTVAQGLATIKEGKKKLRAASAAVRAAPTTT